MDAAKTRSFKNLFGALRRTARSLPLKGLLYACAGFAAGAGKTVGGVSPFGIALLCSAPGRYITFVFAGVLAASLFDGVPPLAAFCAAYIFCAEAALKKRGQIRTRARILLAASAGAVKAAGIAFAGINGGADVFALAFAIITFPLFCWLYRGFFDKRRAVRRGRYEAALIAFAFTGSAVCAEVLLFGANVCLLPAAVCTLCLAKRYGCAAGTACGLVCGLVSGGAATGALGVLGMTCGLLMRESETLALLLAFPLAVSGWYYLAGAETTPAAAGLLLAAFAVFIPLKRFIRAGREYGTRPENREGAKKLARCAAAFSALASAFRDFSESARNESVESLNKRICAAAEAQCERCAERGSCRDGASGLTNFFTTELRRSGVVAYAEIPGHLTAACPNAAAMAREVNGLRAQRRKNGETGLKRMAEEYSAVSEILAEAGRKNEESLCEDRAAAKAVKRELDSLRVTCDGVRVTGGRLREVTVYGVIPDRISATPKEIARALEKHTGTRMSEPQFILHDDYTLMTSSTLPRVRLDCARFSEAKSGERVCGDTVSVFESDDRRFYCLLSDGMGSGRDAAMTSRLAALMLEKLISAGAEKESALRVMNSALAEKKGEISATVDLLEIDRVRCTATLIKAGAAPTLVIRGGRTEALESRTPPAGIMRGVIAEKKTFRVESGDMIVMMSDGIQQTGSAPVLPETGIPPMPSAHALASRMLRDARARGEAADDMSVCVIRVI
ncbi:MAG: SpoIIE family protein phosphatase [Clostridia bacterium]|nr:SpoIIE family protein phosphatase [Clostridia bacterium]